MKLNPNVIFDRDTENPSSGASLIIDDDEAITRLLALLLNRQGIRTLVASSATEAISLWKRHDYEIGMVIANAGLQADDDGFALAHRFKLEKPTLKIIFASGYPRSHFNEEDRMEGVNFVEKPYNSSALIEILRGCVPNTAITR